MYGGLTFILAVCSLHRVTDGRGKVGGDNDKALLLSTKKVKMVFQLRKHSDILLSICKVRTSIPMALEFNHMRGHQDDRVPNQLLDRPSHINTKFDALEIFSQGEVETEYLNKGGTST